jgi:FMN phosphatase YigB (HAD superfamily)
MLHGAPRETLSQYYSEAYEDLDMSRLLKFSKPESDRTGYTLTFASLALRKLSHLHDTLYVASNSPLFHVKRVLARLGIQNLPVAGVLTPDTRYACA